MTKKIFLAILLINITLQLIVDQVKVTGISTSLTSDSSNLQGSLEGGRTLYINGYGFDKTAVNTKVMVGPFPCDTFNMGVTEGIIACDTTKWDQSVTNSTSLQISVSIEGKGTDNTRFYFKYVDNLTPLIKQIKPKYANPGDKIKFSGIHKIKNLGFDRELGDIREMKIGNQLCSRFDLFQQQLSNEFDINFIQCYVSLIQTANFYMASEWFSIGKSTLGARAFQSFPGFATSSNTNPDPILYVFSVVPIIESLDSNQMGTQGIRLKITGKGFSANMNENKIKYGSSDCAIVSSKYNEIICDMPELNAEPGQNFISGGGVIMDSFYNIGQDAANMFEKFHDGIDYYSLSNYYQTKIHQTMSYHFYDKTPQNFDNYKKKFRTFFKAEYTGKYRFYVSGDDWSQVWLSSTPNTATIAPDLSNMKKIVQHKEWITDQYFYHQFQSQISQQIQFQQGNYYYIEAYNKNGGAYGHFFLSVQVPYFNDKLINPAFEIQKLSFVYNANPLIFEFKILGATGGRFKLKNVYRQELQIITKEIGMNFDASAQTVNNQLNNWEYRYYFGYYDTTVTRQDITENGKTGFKYTVTVKKFRSNNVIPTLDLSGLQGTVEQTSVQIVQNRSDPIGGEYNLFFNSQPVTIGGKTNINFNQDLNNNDFKKSLGSQNFEVFRSTASFQDGAQFFIYFVGSNQDLPCFTGSFIGNSSITIKCQKLRTGSNKLFLQPIPSNYLFMPNFKQEQDRKPNVEVLVNNVRASCQYQVDCTLSLIEQSRTPVVSSFSYNGNSKLLTLGMTFEDLDSHTDLQLRQIFIVQFAGSTCKNYVGNKASFTCELQKVKAGSYFPKVHVKNLGFSKVSGSKIQIPLTISNVNPKQSSLIGGITSVITGENFPFEKTDDLQIMICNEEVEILSVSNTQIKVIVPENPNCQQNQLSISFQGKTATSLFQYIPNQMTITSISPTSSSPIQKKEIIITGTGFGTDRKILRAFLKSRQKEYEINVNQATETQLTCTLGGGKSDNYQLYVVKNGNSKSNEISFQYLIKITSFSPTSGSTSGGTVLTITGQNFSTDKTQNQVLIGYQLDWICLIITSTETQITCRTPAKHSSYNQGQGQNIVVLGNLAEQSVCSGICSFTYSNSMTPTVQVPSKTNYKSGQTVTLAGTGLANAKVFVGEKQVTPTTNTDTSIEFVFPNIVVGTYKTNVFVQNKGYASSLQPLNLVTSCEISGFPSSGSLAGYLFESSQSNGLALDLSDPLARIYQSTNTSNLIPLKEVSGNKISFIIPPIETGKTITYVYDYNNGECKVNLGYRGSQTAPILSLQNSNTTFQQSKTITLNKAQTNPITKVTLQLVNSENQPQNIFIQPETTGFTDSDQSVVFQVNNLYAGTYKILASYANGLAQVSSFLTINTDQPQVQQTDVSFAGKNDFVITGNNFNTKLAEVFVCNKKAQVIEKTENEIKVNLPLILTNSLQNQYKIGKEAKIQGTPFGDNQEKINLFKDNLKATDYQAKVQGPCQFGLNFGNKIINLKKVSLFPSSTFSNPAEMLSGLTLYSKKANGVWTLIHTYGAEVQSGWNYWIPDSQIELNQIKVVDSQGLSQCKISQLQVYGIEYDDFTIANNQLSCNLDVKFGANSFSFANLLTYKISSTPIVQSLNIKWGITSGGQSLIISGSNFGNDLNQISVKIDGIVCDVKNVIATSITCTTQQRSPSQRPTQNSFQVFVNGNKAFLKETFLYVDRYSDQRSWGGDLPPKPQDTVYVPKGMTLLIDSNVKVQNIISEGNLIFSDQKDMNIDVNFIIVNSGGKFQAGTQLNPYQHKLVFTLHGDIEAKQLPTFGSKFIGCEQCQFDMHGIVRTPTWTMLQHTANKGDKSITLMVEVDWKVGQHIVIATTSFDNFESQERIISSVSSNKKEISFETPLLYKHYSEVETFGTESFPMRCQVALLTRNIVVQGDQKSEQMQFGSHLMLHGQSENGFVGRISYSQFTQCGQPKIMGRYCIHFHLNGQVSNSYVIGNAVHHSHARILTLHGIHYLKVQKNVGYYVHGHNFFLEDGIETMNVIEDNLAITAIQSFKMLQTDISVANFWVTNPLNTFRRNHAAGSDFYGLWYQIKSNPDGPSATRYVCPTGNQLGDVQDNVAHSTGRFGLRVFILASRKYPCQGISSTNPSIQTVFDNFTLWTSGEAGFLGEQLGNVKITNFKISDSVKAGIQFHKTNLVQQKTIAQNILIVGQSEYMNGQKKIQKSYGVITPRSDGFKASNIRFYNFGPKMTVYLSCSQCDNELLWQTGGKASEFERISYTNILGNYIKWNNFRREIFYDLDGSLIGSNGGKSYTGISSVTPFFYHNNVPGACENVKDKWDNSIFCDNTLSLRKVLFYDPKPRNDLYTLPIKIVRVNSALQQIPENFTQIDVVDSKLVKSGDRSDSWGVPFATNQIYDIKFNNGVDFESISLQISSYFTTNENGFILRFPFFSYRQTFDVYLIESTQNLIIATNALEAGNCNLGQNSFYIQEKMLTVCISGKGNENKRSLRIDAIKCRLLACPSDDQQVDRQDRERLWSRAADWENNNNSVPTVGQNVTIPGQWTMIIDQNIDLDFLDIKGIVKIANDRDISIAANNIFVRQTGEFHAGTKQAPYTHNLLITLNGNLTSNAILVDALMTGNKMLVVTGKLNLYGKKKINRWTRLTETAIKGATQIKVENIQQWQVGDQIVMGPSYSNTDQHQSNKIVAVDSNAKKLTLENPLSFEHYGDNEITIKKQGFGTLDMRTAVGKLNNNIIIQKGGGDQNTHGCRVVVYGTVLNGVPYVGEANFSNVHFKECGQKDTSNAALEINSRIKVKEDQQLRVLNVQNCAFSNCKGWCLSLKNIENVNINNNVFYVARKYLVYVEYTKMYNFTNNLLIGAKKRKDLVAAGNAFDDAACYQQYVPINFKTDKVNVSENVCQGSQEQGIVFPHIPCQDMQNIQTQCFFNNTASSCKIGFMLNANSNFDCLGGLKMKAFANQIGLMAHPAGPSRIIYRNFIFVDNIRGITQRYAHSGTNNYMIVQNSYFNAIARPKCIGCYGNSKTVCSNSKAIKLLVITEGGQSFPIVAVKNDGYDIVCTAAVFDSRAYFRNNLFQNYKNSYIDLPQCSNNYVFDANDQASDMTASHYLTNCSCNDCQDESIVRFKNPSPGWLGWFGGCGQINCTGPTNYLIDDQSGQFFGINQLIPKNIEIGSNQPNCVQIAKWNGYKCQGQQFILLQFQSIAPDFNKRMTWPVYISYQGGNWTNVINGFREWGWDGPQPTNTRIGTFISLSKINKIIELKYESQPPEDSRYMIQKRKIEGEPNIWNIIKLKFLSPNSIQVSVNNIIIQPFRLDQNKNLSQNIVCGNNIFFYQNSTIHFVVTASVDCIVRIKLVNSIQLTTRITTSLDEFFKNDGISKFIAKITTFLNIDTSRLKIVGIKEGSVIIDYLIQSKNTSSQQNAMNVTVNKTQLYNQLQQLASKLDQQIKKNPSNFLEYPIESHTYEILATKPIKHQQVLQYQSKINLIIILSVVSIITLLLVIIIVSVYLKRIRRKGMLQLHEQELKNAEEKNQQDFNE